MVDECIKDSIGYSIDNMGLRIECIPERRRTIHDEFDFVVGQELTGVNAFG